MNELYGLHGWLGYAFTKVLLKERHGVGKKHTICESRTTVMYAIHTKNKSGLEMQKNGRSVFENRECCNDNKSPENATI